MQSNNCSLFQEQIQKGRLDISRLGRLAEAYKRIRVTVKSEKSETFKDLFSGFEFRISSNSPACRSH